MKPIPVIAIFDIGKTNKKLFLFDEQYKIVFEKTSHLAEIMDEDGDACEDIEGLRQFIFDSLKEIFGRKEFDIKAINFSAYGASFVYIDEYGKPLTRLYNYLKTYPAGLSQKFYKDYGGKITFSKQTASPVLGSLNSGMQLYRLKYEQPAVFRQLKYALHLPQYISWMVSGMACADITSIGCHTGLWDFQKNNYHEWVSKEKVIEKMAPLMAADSVTHIDFDGHNFVAGIGLHDSSAALIPYLLNFPESFLLISTGTWCISLNPFNNTPLTTEELENDCLCYLDYRGKPIKASRLFAGYEHDLQVKRIILHFNQDSIDFRVVGFDPDIISRLKERNKHQEFESLPGESIFGKRDLSAFSSGIEAYHQLMLDIIHQQYLSSKMILQGDTVKRIFVDGGFSGNEIYMYLLASVFPEMEVFAAYMAQATSLGAALVIHHAWNEKNPPSDIIHLKYYPPA